MSADRASGAPDAAAGRALPPVATGRQYEEEIEQTAGGAQHSRPAWCAGGVGEGRQHGAEGKGDVGLRQHAGGRSGCTAGVVGGADARTHSRKGKTGAGHRLRRTNVGARVPPLGPGGCAKATAPVRARTGQERGGGTGTWEGGRDHRDRPGVDKAHCARARMRRDHEEGLYHGSLQFQT